MRTERGSYVPVPFLSVGQVVVAFARKLSWIFKYSRGNSVVALGYHSTCSLLHRLICASGLLIISGLVVGCAGVTQQPKVVDGLAFSATSFDFQTVAVGQTATKTLNISNTGSAAVQISAVSVSNKSFSISGPSVPRTILPANSATYTLTYAPTAAGNVSASVSISTSVATNPVSISLAGKGKAVSTDLAISPAIVNFGNLALKSTSTQNVTIQNTGDATLSLQGVTVSGTGFGYSNLSPGFSLAPNQKVTFQVWFSPKAAGPASGTLTLLSSNLSSPGTLSMSGDGVSSTNPNPPTNPSTQHSVALNWAASASQVIGYRVYRSESSSGSYSPLNGTAITALNYSDSTVASGNTYYYVVTSVDSSGDESIYSNQAKAVIP